MNYLQAFAISASGMAVEKARLDVTAANLANVHSTRAADGTPMRALRVLSRERRLDFDGMLSQAGDAGSLGGAQIVGLQPVDAAPRLVYEPGNPEANEQGFVAYPGIDPVGEMMNMLTAVRAYEANVAALNAAKTMALRALQIGG